MSIRSIIFASLFIAFVSNSTASDFTDGRLNKTIQTSKSGVIYTWSPAFPLSLKELPEIKKIAHELSLHLTVLRDPFTPVSGEEKKLVLNTVGSTGLHTIESKTLIEKGALLHYPCIYLYANGKLKEQFAPAYHSPSETKRLIMDLLSSESKSRTSHPPKISKDDEKGVVLEKMVELPNQIYSFAPVKGTDVLFFDLKINPDKRGVLSLNLADPNLAFNPAPGRGEMLVTPDNKYYLVQEFDPKLGPILGFYPLSDVLSLGMKATPEFIERFGIDYPSIGAYTLNEKTVYRFASYSPTPELSGYYLFDYSTIGESGKLVRIGSPINFNHCEGTGVMMGRISSDATLFSHFDTTTRISHLDVNGVCSKTYDLGFYSSKLQFSPDHSQVGFNLEVKNPLQSIQHVSDNYQLVPFLRNLESGKTIKLTVPETENFHHGIPQFVSKDRWGMVVWDRLNNEKTKYYLMVVHVPSSF